MRDLKMDELNAVSGGRMIRTTDEEGSSAQDTIVVTASYEGRRGGASARSNVNHIPGSIQSDGRRGYQRTIVTVAANDHDRSEEQNDADSTAESVQPSPELEPYIRIGWNGLGATWFTNDGAGPDSDIFLNSDIDIGDLIKDFHIKDVLPIEWGETIRPDDGFGAGLYVNTTIINGEVNFDGNQLGAGFSTGGNVGAGANVGIWASDLYGGMSDVVQPLWERAFPRDTYIR